MLSQPMIKIFERFKGDGLEAQLIRGFTGNSGLKISNIILTLASGVLLARVLGPEGYGVYAFALSIIALLGLPTQGGGAILVVRETARYHHASAWGKLRGLLLKANIFAICISIFTMMVAGALAWWFWGIHSEQAKIFYWALLLLPLVAFSNVRSATLRGLRRVVQGNLPEQVIRPLVTVLLLLCAVLLGWQVTPKVAVQYTLLGALLAFVVGTVLLARAFPQKARITRPQSETKLWLKSLVPLTLFSSLNIVNNQIGIVLIGVLGTPEDVGFFRVAFQGAALVAFGLLVLNAVLAPHVVRLYESGKKAKLQRMLTSSARAGVFLSLPLVVIYMLWGDIFVMMLFGDEYLPAASALSILAIGQFINVASGSVGLLLNMLGHEIETVKASIIALVVNITIAILLIPSIGATGAAIATAMSVGAWNVLLVIRTYQITGINTTGIKLR